METIISYVLMGCSILVTIATTIITIVNKIKSGKTGVVNELLQSIPELITKAEQIFGEGKGAAKLEWCLTQLEIKALKHGTAINTEEWTEKINNAVATTKNVNVNGGSVNGGVNTGTTQ